MKTGKWLVATMVLVGGSYAGTLDQKYEKAYYLETAKGKVMEAAAIYQSIAAAASTDANKDAIKKSLLRLLHIGTPRKHEPTIKDCHEKLLSKTDTTIQELVESAKEGSTIYIPAGTYKETLVLGKKLTLKGADRDGCILEAEADQPVIHVMKKQDVLIESLTLKSQLETSERTDPPGCALLVKDAKATLKDCAVIALGSSKRSPLGVFVQGFSEVQLINSVFEGYAYPIFFADGTEGLVKGCVVKNPTDCGFMSHAESEVTIEGNIFTGSAKHGVRSTGGTIHLKDNLIVKNRNRGIYLGNKTTHGEIINNAIVENGSGISTFASSDVEIENNVIIENGYSGIDTRVYGQIQVKNNIIADNQKTGFAVFEEGSTKFKVGKNTFHGNGEPSTDYKLPSSTLDENPKFAKASDGDFTVENNAVKSAGHGLTDPSVISILWKKYEEAVK
jgi:nitrous oxidase accessory protein NosD